MSPEPRWPGSPTTRGRLLVGHKTSNFVAGLWATSLKPRSLHGGGKGTASLTRWPGVIPIRATLTQGWVGSQHISCPEKLPFWIRKVRPGFRLVGVWASRSRCTLAIRSGRGLEIFDLRKPGRIISSKFVDFSSFESRSTGTHSLCRHARSLQRRAAGWTSSCLTLSGWASLSDLVDFATTIGHFGGAGVADASEGLGANAVIGGHHRTRHVG